jgi:hypothetical protein
MLEDQSTFVRPRPRSVGVSARCFVLFALGLGVLGCGDAASVAPGAGAGQVVKGKVLLAGGKPLTKGRLMLLPKQEPMLPLYGELGPDGSYTLKAGGLMVGVSHGEFLVSIEPSGGGIGPGVKTKSLGFPAKYLSPDNGLTVSINAETKELPPIELK